MFLSRRSSASRLPIHLFWLVAIATQINFNHVSNMIVGTGWFVTLGLALCGVFLILAVRFPFRRTLGPPGYLVVAALISYVVIGGAVMLLTDAAWRLNNYRFPLLVGLAVLMIVASALGASVVMRRIGIEPLLARILVIKAVVCILILASPWLLKSYQSLPEYYLSTAEERFLGTFSSPNIAGAAACQAVVLALSLLNSRYRKFAWAVVILGSAAVVMTFSRTAIIILILILAFFLWSSMSNVHPERRQSTAVWLTLAFMVVVFGLAAVNREHLPLKPGQLERIEWVMTFGSTDSRIERFEIWPLGMSLIAESPLLGHGLSQFHHLEGAPTCYGGTEVYTITCGVHNSYMMLWGEAGIVPLALFLLFIGALLRTRLVLPKSIATDTIAGWTLVIAVECISADGVPFSVWNAFIIGLTCAMTAHVASERRTARAPEVWPASGRTMSHSAAPP